MGSVWGNAIKLSIFGESHGGGIGCVLDGFPAGVPYDEAFILAEMDRRAPGKNRQSTARREKDLPKVLSGVFEGKTSGAPISCVIENTDTRSKDYRNLIEQPRPGHADYTYDCKYGFRDYTGGGRSSGRETIGRVAAGAVAAKLLQELGITVTAYTRSIGPVQINDSRFDLSEMERNAVNMPDAEAAEQAMAYLDACRTKEDSCGGVVECVIKGVPAGVGDPCFDKLSANLSKSICSIGAVKGFEIGDGFLAARSCGSENNDAFYMKEDGSVGKKTNHAGGILGGISDGSDIIFRAAFKPTPSISALQHTVNKSGEDIEVSIHGRHDPIIVPRAVVVVECMAAITVLDGLLTAMTSRVDLIKKFWSR